jgi:hypothetical protein
MALETMNLSAFGTKVRLDEPVFELGMPAHLHFEPPDGRRLDVHAIVWRRDPDGSAFFFIGVDGDNGAFPFQLEARRAASAPFPKPPPDSEDRGGDACVRRDDAGRFADRRLGHAYPSAAS